ncbi:GntR family transcriptional regulator [Kutzneria sp. CA-103260]|uniref:GntR family transcriptional regulator n=1 Tax=Kutzneria sp. CA-103260 TaxID=2802641 RepID=UPI001BA4923E|nr:GntR family transcriptional regulator [Kutzneria sp. CA-103260]QUQ70442.1 Bacterial regulatory protein, gntR family [Kutzneria sp. CA-103260]
MENSRTPAHPFRVLADTIAAKVERGDLKPGDQIPSVRALAKEYGVTTATAQKAVRRLTDDGVVTTVQGLGIFVADSAPDASGDRPVGLHDVMRELDRLQQAVTALDQRVQRLEGPDSD